MRYEPRRVCARDMISWGMNGSKDAAEDMVPDVQWAYGGSP